ncbi:MAG: FkbM family methyltransferase, partial [Bacteroidota bacterium]
PSFIQFHSPAKNYVPHQSLSTFNGRKLVIAQHQPTIYTDARIVPNLIDIWDTSFRRQPTPQHPIKIFYSWASERDTRWGNKGSQATRAILARIKNKYRHRVDIRILNNIPYSTCLQEKQSAHICIDECITGSYHLQSLEGCAMGALTINNLSNTILGFIQHVTHQASHPFVRTSIHQLYHTLCHYIDHPHLLQAKGQAARTWMEQYWNPQELIFEYIGGYEGGKEDGGRKREDGGRKREEGGRGVEDGGRREDGGVGDGGWGVSGETKIIDSELQDTNKGFEAAKRKPEILQAARSRTLTLKPKNSTSQTPKLPNSSTPKPQNPASKTHHPKPNPLNSQTPQLPNPETQNPAPETLKLPNPSTPKPLFSLLHQKHLGQDLYILGTGPSIFKVEPDYFKDRICLGINFSFEVIPYVDYVLTHVLEAYEAIRKVIDNKKLLLPPKLVQQSAPAKDKKTTQWVPHYNTEATIYPIQDPNISDPSKKQVQLARESAIFTLAGTAHSAIHLAAYMGAKRIFLVGMDYQLYPNKKVHFESKYYPSYGKQTWHALAKLKMGDEWLARQLRKQGIIVQHYPRKPVSPKPVQTPVLRRNSLFEQRYTYTKLYQKYAGKDIYIFGSGPSILGVDPKAFKHKICIGINYTFEKVPFLDYIMVHEIETYESIKHIVDNRRLILPDFLVRHSYGGKGQSKYPPHLKTNNPKAYIYPVSRDGRSKGLGQRSLSLQRETSIFTFTTTTHSAIHLAAYMGAKNIYLIGVDYQNFEDGKVHFESKYSRMYGQQNWQVFRRHKRGDEWLRQRLAKFGIHLENISSNYRRNGISTPTPPRALQQKILINKQPFYVLSHWFWKQYSDLQWEPSTYQLLQHYLHPASVFIDIGTWIGITSFYAAELGVKKIYGVEANPNTYKMVKENCYLNQIDADIQNLCIHQQEAMVSFGNPKTGTKLSSAASIRGDEWKIQGIRLSTYLAKYCPDNWEVMKIDIEGAEAFIADDLTTLSKRPNTTILLSLHPPFWTDQASIAQQLLAALEGFRVLDAQRSPLSLTQLTKRILSKEKKPAWGTPYGNFFEVVLEGKY